MDMISDRPLSATATAATLFWVAAVALVIVAIATGRDGWGQLGILSGCMGCVLHVRHMLQSMATRERAAFNLGRAAGPKSVSAEHWADN